MVNLKNTLRKKKSLRVKDGSGLMAETIGLLLKLKEVIKRNVPSENAVEELIELIKTNGDWTDYQY